MSLWLLALCLAVVRAQDSETTGARINAEGVTEIFGSSFGRPGLNLTFDYIVGVLRRPEY